MAIPSKSDLQVLVVDDEPALRSLFTSFLEYLNCFSLIKSAANGVEAKELCKNFKFDIIVTDLTMPQGNGLDLVEHLKRNYPAAAIIVLTGTMDQTVIEFMRESKLDAVLLKPCTIDQFNEVVLQVLKAKKYI